MVSPPSIGTMRISTRPISAIVHVFEAVMQVAEMADAQPGDLEDEDRIAVSLHGDAGVA